MSCSFYLFLHVFDESTVMIQMELKEDLAEEAERNQDGIMHLEMLREHYDEQGRRTVYLSPSSPVLPS